MNELLQQLKSYENRDLYFRNGKLWLRNLAIDDAILWAAPDLQQIADEIEAIVDGYYGDNWSHIMMVYAADYYHGEGISWQITTLTVTMKDDTEGYDASLEDAIENHGKYAFLAEALIDTLYRGELLDE